jgi:hypothetical protein
MKKTRTVWEYLRIKFKPGTDPKGKRTKFSRPTRVYKISYFTFEENKPSEEAFDHFEYAPTGVKGTSKRIKEDDFIVEWERGPIPTPKPSRKYTDEQLKAFGYSDELIEKIRRNYSSKDIKLVCNNLKDKKTGKRLTRIEAMELLNKNKGNRHKIYICKNTKGIKIDGDWKTIIPGDKSEQVKTNMEYHHRRNQYLKTRNKKVKTKSIQKKRAKRGF